ncbi:MAG: AmmeMemoRadiSam system protein B [Acidobacteria bacterium]|nr:MAG: AmmeMemoRadiSam system protein B [Acidobacteriota bacterium]
MEPTLVRSPAVAGRFYPHKREALLRDVDHYLEYETDDEKTYESAIACVVPHAGYMYSGHVAGAVFRLLPAHSHYVIMGPNHSARGAPLAVMSRGSWLTPLGHVELDTELAGYIREKCAMLAEDAEAHASEHSLEVQLPFLQRLSGTLTFVPIAIAIADYTTLLHLGWAVADAVRRLKEPVMIVASSDMNHYEPDSVTREKDDNAIEKILQLDPAGLMEVIREMDISMCGYAPTIAVLAAAKKLGASRARLIRHATSADATGDTDSVVGYAGIIVY